MIDREYVVYYNQKKIKIKLHVYTYIVKNELTKNLSTLINGEQK